MLNGHTSECMSAPIRVAGMPPGMLATHGGVDAAEQVGADDTTRVDAHQLCRGGEDFGAAAAAVLCRGVDQHSDPTTGVGKLRERHIEHCGVAAARLRESAQHLQGR